MGQNKNSHGGGEDEQLNFHFSGSDALNTSVGKAGDFDMLIEIKLPVPPMDVQKSIVLELETYQKCFRKYAYYPGNGANRKRRVFQAQLMRSCELFSFILPPAIRRRAYEPAYNDLKTDFLAACRFKTKWARRWLEFCFISRTVFMVIECGRVAISSKIGQILLGLVPESIREFFRSN